jgi:hypothetical protein
MRFSGFLPFAIQARLPNVAVQPPASVTMLVGCNRVVAAFTAFKSLLWMRNDSPGLTFSWGDYY